MESTRQQKVARLLLKELGVWFQQHGNEILPGRLITVTIVRITPDLGLAKVYLSIFPSGKKEETLNRVINHTGQIRNAIGHKVKNQLRIIPEFQYFLDDSLDYIENIDNLLKE